MTPPGAAVLDAALAGLDRDRLAADLGTLVTIPSVTGSERAVVERLAEMAAAAGLEATVVEHDLAALRESAGHPGEEVDRTELLGLRATLPGTSGMPRLCLDGHVDVVGPGTAPWGFGPWSGDVVAGEVRGRGSVDMKAGVVAALHAMAAVRAAGATPIPEVVLLAVSSEEDGGLGTFAALQEDAAYDACLIPEPTELAVVCAQAGAATFRGIVPGRSAHAATRLDGCSAIDRYVEIHRALGRHEVRLNTDVERGLMAELELPYPLVVGRIDAGEWSSQVPDRLVFEGRLGVRIGESLEDARAALERVVADATDDGEAPVQITWSGGQFAPAQTPVSEPFVERVRTAAAEELGHRPACTAVAYGADMRLFCERGIPCVMFGTTGLALAHAVDERVSLHEVELVARTIVRLILGGWS